MTSTCQLDIHIVVVGVFCQEPAKTLSKANSQECSSELRALNNVSFQNQEGAIAMKETSVVQAKKQKNMAKLRTL